MPSIYDKLNTIDDDMDRDDVYEVTEECESEASKLDYTLQKLERVLEETSEDFDNQTIGELKELLEGAKDEVSHVRARLY